MNRSEPLINLSFKILRECLTRPFRAVGLTPWLILAQCLTKYSSLWHDEILRNRGGVALFNGQCLSPPF